MLNLNAIRTFGRNSPLTVALLIHLAVFGVFLWSLLKNGTIDATDPSGQVDITYVIDSLGIETIAAGLMLGVIWLFGWGKSTYLTTKIDSSGLIWGIATLLMPIVLTVVFASLVLVEGSQADQLPIIIKLFLFCIMVGIFEETLFRGTLFHGLSRHLSPFWAMILSSVLFGLFHMQNIMVGQEIGATMFQSLNAFALGIVFCAVMLQTNSIWWAIALHTVWNAFLFISAYILQKQPTLLSLSPEELAQSQNGADITLSAFGLPLFLLLLGFVIFARWDRRLRSSDATA